MQEKWFIINKNTSIQLLLYWSLFSIEILTFLWLGCHYFGKLSTNSSMHGMVYDDDFKKQQKPGP